MSGVSPTKSQYKAAFVTRDHLELIGQVKRRRQSLIDCHCRSASVLHIDRWHSLGKAQQSSIPTSFRVREVSPINANETTIQYTVLYFRWNNDGSQIAIYFAQRDKASALFCSVCKISWYSLSGASEMLDSGAWTSRYKFSFPLSRMEEDDDLERYACPHSQCLRPFSVKIQAPSSQAYCRVSFPLSFSLPKYPSFTASLRLLSSKNSFPWPSNILSKTRVTYSDKSPHEFRLYGQIVL